MLGVDYAFSPTGFAAFWASSGWTSGLKAAGVKFAGRYVSPLAENDANGKNLTPAELKALRAAGLEIILYAEQYAGRMKEGHAAGVADARHFDAVVKALGMAGAIMYCAADWDATPGDQTAINAYLDGAASVRGRDLTGIYGGYYVVKRALDAGKAAHAVQTLAWSGGQWDPRADVRQGLSISVGGVRVDRLDSQKADFGQWPRPVAPPPPTGPFRHQVGANNTASLDSFARGRGTTQDALVKLSTPILNAPNLAIMTAYLALDDALAAAGHPHPAMPEGMVFWTVNP